MNEQTRTASAAQPEDAWDRLAALAFGGAASAGGCSVHAHDYDCSCQGGCAADAATPDAERPVYSDPEFEIVD